jgi:hypothetical protein
VTTALTRICSVLYPICFAVFPALSLFAQNQTDVGVSVLWPPVVACVAAALALFALLLALTRSAARAGALAALALAWFAYFGIFSDAVAGLHVVAGLRFAIWTALFAAVAFAVARSRIPLAPLTLIATAGALALAVPAAVRVAAYQIAHPPISLRDRRLWSTTLAPPAATPAARPDIYVIIPDDYARQDVLQRYFQTADDRFMRALSVRGFVVSPQVRSPYSDSESNIAAELNLEYLDGLPRILGARSEDVRPVKRLIADNRAARLLAPLGYRYVHLDTDEVTFGASNPAISPLAPPDSFANLWLRKSVLALVGGPVGFSQAATDARFRSSIGAQFRALEATAGTAGPKFVVFHTLLPHDPYVYAANGAPVTFPSRSEDDLGNRLGMGWYRRQLEYVGTRLLRAIDAIDRQSRTSPVIVIESDEGFQADPRTVGGDAAMQDIRVKGLLALRVPGARQTGVPQPPNTVNTLRFVFNHTLGTHYPMLRSASSPEVDLPYQFEPMRVR